MAKVTFTGPADIRELDSDDLKRHAGVEGFRKTSFRKGEAKDVDDAVAQALIEHPDVFGDFELGEVEEKQTELEGLEAGEASASGSNSTTDSTPRSRPNGASTRTR